MNFRCEKLSAKLSVEACVKQQELPSLASPCQDCTLGRSHAAQLGRERVYPSPELHPFVPGQCYVCESDARKLNLCEKHYSQLNRRGRLFLPGSLCPSCRATEAQANGLCAKCSRKKPGAKIQGPHVDLQGAAFLFEGRRYTVTETRLWGRGVILGMEGDLILIQTTTGLMLGRR